MDEKQLEKLIANLKVGIAKIESGSFRDPYSAQPPVNPKTGKRASSATGKYQFLKQWMDDTKNAKGETVKGIVSFAKESGAFGAIESMEDFKNSPELQEAYFTYYAKNVLIPEAQKIAAKNPLNLTLDEIASQVHFQGYSKARDTIQTGKLLSKTRTNVSQAKYIKKYREGLAEVNLKPIKYEDLIKEVKDKAISKGEKPQLTPVEKKIEANSAKVRENFKKRNESIDALDLPQGTKELMRKKLFQEYVNNGHRNIANDYIKEMNRNKAQNIAEYKELISVAQKIKFGYEEDNLKSRKTINENAIFVPWKDSDDDQMEKLDKRYGIINRVGAQKGKYMIKVDELFNAIENKHKIVTGKELNLDRNVLKDDKNIRFDRANFFEVIQGLDDITHGKAPSKQANIYFENLDPINESEIPLIDEQTYPKQKDVIEEIIKEEEAEAAKEKDPSSTITISDDQLNEEPKKDDGSEYLGLAEEYFQTELALNSVDDGNLNYGDTEGELPVDAIVGMSLGLIGRDQAQNANIPLRTEDISEAVKNYAAELAERKEQGLPIEVEAAMKNQLADVYQAGLANIVNASGGNRALVLGNQGALAANKQKGLTSIAIADFEAKDRAFQQYGEIVKYMDQFEANKDIANHQIEYTEAKRKQRMGEDLANSGFAKLIESLNYQKNNGPGSANDMYRSFLMQRMFGFDPKMKDDGSGTVVGTQSYYESQKSKKYEERDQAQSIYDNLRTLSPEQKIAFDSFFERTNDKKSMSQFMDYLKKNPELDLSKMTMDNFELAQKDGNFDMLFGITPEEKPKGLLDEALPKTQPGLATPSFNPEILSTAGGLASAALTDFDFNNDLLNQ